MNAGRSHASEDLAPSRTLPWFLLLGMAALICAGGGAWKLWGPGEMLNAKALPRPVDERLFPIKDIGSASNLAALRHAQVKLIGKFIGPAVLLKEREMAGRSGYYVLQAFVERGEAGVAVLVQRGWILPKHPDLDIVFHTPAHDVVIDGRLAFPSLGVEAKAASETGRVRENMSLQAFGREIGMPLVPMVVLEEPGDGTTEMQIRADLLKRRWGELYPQDKYLSRNAWMLIALGGAFGALSLWMGLTRRGNRADG